MSENKLSRITAYKLKTDDLDNINFPGYELVKFDDFILSEKKLKYKLFFLKQFSQDADWFKVFSGIKLQINKIPQKMVSGYILVVQLNASFYALTGGVGHSHLKKNYEVEHRFGIDIAEKILSIPEIKGLVQKNTSGNITYLNRVFRGAYNPKGDVNNLKMVLSNVRGKISKDSDFYLSIGKSLNAGDALSVNGAKNLEEIMAFLAKIDDLFHAQGKKISIPQLEPIKKKHYPKLLGDLELQLIEHLCNYNRNNSTLFLDNDEIGYLPDRVVSYEVCFNRKTEQCDTYEEVFECVKTLLSEMESSNEKVRAINKIKLNLTFDDDTSEKRDLLYFICGDVLYENEVYFINNKYWYKASEEFIERVNEEINNIEYISSDELNLLEWDTSKYSGRMAEYNYNLAHKSTYVCLDHKLVKIPSERGGIEFCDLMSKSSNGVHLLHVKKAHGAALRALFAQGFVSAKFYDEDDEFKKKVLASDLKREGEDLTAQEKNLLNSIKSVNKRNIKIIYSIFDDSPSHIVSTKSNDALENLNGTLTAFAKVDLLDRVNTIRAMGYNVALTRIKPYPIKEQKGITHEKSII